MDDDPGYGDAHIIEVLCEKVSDEYLAYLRGIGVSYVFAGKDEMDLLLTLNKLKSLFGIEKMLLEGGSIINGAFARAELIGELSLVVAPVTAGEACGDLLDNVPWEDFVIKDVKKMNYDVAWKRYRKYRE